MLSVVDQFKSFLTDDLKLVMKEQTEQNNPLIFFYTQRINFGLGHI